MGDQMNAQFSFNLPEEQETYDIFNQSGEMASALSEIYMFLRRVYKHGHNYQTADDAVNDIYTKFFEFCEDLHNVF